MSQKEDASAKKSKLSRRSFLIGAGAGAAVTAVVAAGVAELTILQPGQGGSTTTVTNTVTSTVTTTQSVQPATPTTLSTITLTVNGVDRTMDVDNRWTLAEALRTKLNLIGTKIGCDRGECGACSVLVDGVPMLSCMMLAMESQKRQITTIEGIGGPQNLSKIQTALLDADGIQCGICMPGIIVVSTAFLKANPTPTDADLKAALAGNLCKCGNWPRILQGLKAVK
jgi:aerobic-type carbon monoxide dehydrogenase small subunit (CoxS/CutS family)